MRHHSKLNAIFRLPLLCAALFCVFLCATAAFADEAADRAAIDRTISALNQFPQSPALFTGDASSDLGRLSDVRPRAIRAFPSDPTSLTISHEPWGEARINLPPIEIVNPKFAAGPIRFLTPGIALVDGTWSYNDGSSTQTKPLLFVVERDGEVWKIASARLLAQ